MEIDTKVKRSLVELNYIISNMSESTRNKIPEELKKSIKDNMDEDYIMNIDLSKDYTEQDFMDETKALLSVLISDYIAEGDYKDKWKEFDDKYVEVMQSKVSTDVFGDRKKNPSKNVLDEDSKQLTKYEQSFIKKLFAKVINIFKKRS